MLRQLENKTAPFLLISPNYNIGLFTIPILNPVGTKSTYLASEYSNLFEFTSPAISIGLKSPLNNMLLERYLELELL